MQYKDKVKCISGQVDLTGKLLGGLLLDCEKNEMEYLPNTTIE